MIILGVAMALTNWLTLGQVPMRLLAWVQSYIEAPWALLLALNVFLIAVGALMDIYSAIIVIVPLLVPLIAAYGLDPIHVGVIFLANMQLGYLMPPMARTCSSPPTASTRRCRPSTARCCRSWRSCSRSCCSSRSGPRSASASSGRSASAPRVLSLALRYGRGRLSRRWSTSASACSQSSRSPPSV